MAYTVWNPWANDKRLLELYKKRCRQEVEEMTCAAQAAEILANKIKPGETLLDAGCGGGYYYWSFKKRKIPIEYYGLDYTPEMIKLAREEMCKQTDLTETRFLLEAIENLDVIFDNIICFNVLTNNPHYALPLERLLKCTKKRLLLRESLSEELKIVYTKDNYVDQNKDINVYLNTYPLEEVKDFIKNFGFNVTQIFDKRSKDDIETVVDVPHYWKILLAEREN